MFFRVQNGSPKPVYQQLMDQVKFAVASGALQPGDRLPPIRDVAVQVRINRNTVARVYAELEREGVLHTTPGQGTFVSDLGTTLSRAEQRRRLVARLDELLSEARLYGIAGGKMRELFEQRLAVVFPADDDEEG